MMYATKPFCSKQFFVCGRSVSIKGPATQEFGFSSQICCDLESQRSIWNTSVEPVKFNSSSEKSLTPRRLKEITYSKKDYHTTFLRG